MNMRRSFAIASVLSALSILVSSSPAQAARLKELVEVDGFRTNHLVGLGLVVGLAGTGDDTSMTATKHPLQSLMRHLGTTVDLTDLMQKNVAMVMVTAELPPFARAGTTLDVTVSSMGNAKSLVGGTLIVTPLKGPDNNVWALAQGSLTLGAWSAGGASGSTTRKNHVTAGHVPNGATLEHDAPNGLPDGQIALLLREPDFTTAWRIASAINGTLGEPLARVRDPGAVIVTGGPRWKGRTVELIALLESIEATPDSPGRVIIDERTGTIAVGANVSLSASAVACGGITVKIDEQPVVSQPNAFTKGAKTEVVAQSDVKVEEGEGRLAPLRAATTVGDVAAALNALGVKPRDLVSIFQALKAAGALRAEIQVL
ncbi:MAG TPA: flagellar basal body P-ring protein FlgI [Polyangia bacterium]|nr:flagellar basal body P-ring protein FlgI [Polyangia bacterium]